MKIALVGYGKMGQAIEKLALSKGHEITARIDNAEWSIGELLGSDVAIEFSEPEAAVENIKKCFAANVPVLLAQTGWYQQYDALADEARQSKKGLFTATNFSVGVNILFYLNEKLAKIMNRFPNYEVSMEETHHIHKKDHPSGTASTLAEDIVKELDRKKKYVGQLENEEEPLGAFDLRVLCKRENEVPGIHQVEYESYIDSIKIYHSAKNRLGFANGALLAAEWMKGKTGVFTMKDLLKFDNI